MVLEYQWGNKNLVVISGSGPDVPNLFNIFIIKNSSFYVIIYLSQGLLILINKK